MPTQLLPTGAALPPLPYLLAVVVAVGAVGLGLRRVRPTVTPRVVAGFAPWMLAGATGYALYQAEAVPALLAPLFGNPVVYATTFAVAGAVWLAVADRPADAWAAGSVPGVLALSGAAAALLLVAAAGATALARDSLAVGPSLAGLAASLVVAGGVWFAVRSAVGATGLVGVLALFGHTLDGISTAVGIELGFGEQTPLSAVLIEFGAGLPPAEVLGEAWLFVLVKVVVATVVLFAFRDYVREEPAEGSLLLGLVAAVGLGPGFHNLVLFAIA
ncbi:DUF63 family protein [Halosegnis marinus]|uniref:DUF63 family protein n=1 Tax=Halosegnis marinus TaxID=3034023 RepID=A0ABD5ZLS2_9EURY|nr:DUF63 family protein [Halosegnis sp. DT85]